MKKILPQDHQKAINLLTAAFKHNRSVNRIVKNDHLKERRIRGLMEYALSESLGSGGAFVSDNEKGVLLFLPGQAKSPESPAGFRPFFLP